MDLYGHGESSRPVDLFGGDFYAGDEGGVTRGVSIAQMPSAFKPASYEKPEKTALFSDAEFAFGDKAQRITFDGTTVELEHRAVSGATLTSAAPPTVLLNSLLTFFMQNCDATVEPNPKKCGVKIHCCHERQLLKIKVAFYVPEHAPRRTAMSWTRKVGDGLHLIQLMKQYSEFALQRGVEVQKAESTLNAVPQFGSLPMPMLGAPEMPRFPWDVDMKGETEASIDETTPCAHDWSLPMLDVLPCAEEDLEPLLHMACGCDPVGKEEAARGFVAMLDGTVDAEVATAVLKTRQDVVESLVADPACVLSGPALLEKLVARDAYDELAAVRLVCRRLRTEASTLGQRQLARALGSIVPTMRVEKLRECEGLADDLATIRSSLNDKATVHYLDEAALALLVIG